MRLDPANYTPEHFVWEYQDGIGRITLNRPERKNPLTFESYAELRDFLRNLCYVPEVKVLIFSGAAENFCSGGDVSDIITRLFERDMEGLLMFTRMTGELIQEIRRCKLPVITSIKRVAAGAGAVIALASDLRVMGSNSFFSFLFPQVGLSGADMGASYLLPRVVGLGLASEILLLGDRVSAQRCLSIGLANQIVDDTDPADVDGAALTLAAKIAAGPLFANRMTKTMLQRELDMTFGDAIEAEAQAQAICMQHPDFKEANDAWGEKRDPKWR